jgi:acyl-CoA thioester hydrolase
MARIKLPLPERFPFTTEIPLRITDINYGGHLGNDAVLGIVQEARVRFLSYHGFSEKDAGGAGIIMVDAVVVYRSEAFYGDVLTVDVAVSDLSTAGCDFVFRIVSRVTGKEVARAKTGIAFFDYRSRSVVPVPEAFRTAVIS